VAKRLFTEAVDLIKRGRRDQAKTLLRRLAREHPKSELAPQALVQAAEIEDNLEEADTILAKVVADYPDSKWVDAALYKRGEVNMLLWDYAKALEMFGLYLKRNPDSEREGTIRERMANCRLKLGQAEQALADLERLVREKPEFGRRPETLETLAECHIAQSKSEQALAPLETLVKKHPTYANFSRVFALYGLCLEDQNRFDDAIDAYRKLVEQFPRSAESGLAKDRLADLRRPLTLEEDAGPSTPTMEPKTPKPKPVTGEGGVGFDDL
jgi:TolA-binding protein